MMNTMMNSSTVGPDEVVDGGKEEWEDLCAVIPPDTTRMVMVAVVGNGIAIVSCVFNAFLFSILVTKRQSRRSHLLYLIIMSLIDVFLSASYILLFPVNLLMDYYESELLSTIWWSSLRPMLALCHVAISMSALLLTAATFERFTTVTGRRPKFPTHLRLVLSSVALVAALLAKGPMFFELRILPNGNCSRTVTAYIPQLAEWTLNEPYKTLYKFWFRSIVSTFLPFFLSLYFNIRIILRLRKQHAAARLFRFATTEHKKHIRSVTTMLVLVSSCYLACNLLNVIVTAWEFLDIESLHREDLRDLYTYSSDMVSLLTVLACAVRLPIYYCCHTRIRWEVNRYLRRLCKCGIGLRKRDFSRDNISLATIRYLNTGNGYVVYSNRHAHQQQTRGEEDERDGRFVIGTGFDKIVLQLAMRGAQASREGGSDSGEVVNV